MRILGIWEYLELRIPCHSRSDLRLHKSSGSQWRYQCPKLSQSAGLCCHTEEGDRLCSGLEWLHCSSVPGTVYNLLAPNAPQAIELLPCYYLILNICALRCGGYKSKCLYPELESCLRSSALSGGGRRGYYKSHLLHAFGSSGLVLSC